MHSNKACLKWTKIQCSKPRLSETFAFEAIIKRPCEKQCLISVLKMTREFCLVIAAKFLQIKGIWKLGFKSSTSP